MYLKDWNIEKETGYKPKTTFYMDFSIADQFGESSIKSTYNKCFKEYKNNVEYITELCMVVNWKSWEHANDKLCKLYCELYYELREWCFDNLQGEDLEYFIQTID